MRSPVVTVAIPSLNQGDFLEEALSSVFSQEVPVEVFVLDGGSTDGSLDIIHRWKNRLAGWRSFPDSGQSAAINEGIARGSAPFVTWLNSDDRYEPGGLRIMIEALSRAPYAPFVYGHAWDLLAHTGKRRPVWVEPFDPERLAVRCIISQPASLLRRQVWTDLNGLDASLAMAMDYDLWWRAYKRYGPPLMVKEVVAANRVHRDTKTNSFRRSHYREAMEVVRRHNGYVPLKWYLAQPYRVWWMTLRHRLLRPWSG